MVMVQLGVPLAEAMMRLRAHAYVADRPLADVARDVISRHVVLDGQLNGGGRRMAVPDPGEGRL